MNRCGDAPDYQNHGPNDADTHLILAHGAGAGMSSPFMSGMTALVSERGIAITTFEFAYMAARSFGGPRRPPPRLEVLVAEYRAVVSQVSAGLRPDQRLIIGGKSLGGRVAGHIADGLYRESQISGLICLGYPFHAVGKPENLRIDHLADFVCPTLILQGDRDPFGNRREIEHLSLPSAITFHWLTDGDHDFGPRGKSGVTRSQNLASAADAVREFTATLPAPAR